jgi:hypothetical protein
MKLPQDPAFIAELAPTAAHITIGDGDSKSLALTLAAIR